MRLWLLLMLTWLSGCGYHLVGHGSSTLIPPNVQTASLELMNQQANYSQLLSELTTQWQQRKLLPSLIPDAGGDNHVTLRIETPSVAFTPSAFDASGLAIQYHLSISAVLSMYQKNELIWSSGALSEGADIFDATDPSVTEAEKERLMEVLSRQWAKDAIARLQSGF